MDFKTIQAIWTDQTGGGPTVPNDELVRSVLKKDRRMARKVKVRDYLELITAVAMAGGLLFVATLAAAPWLWILAALVTLGVGVVFVRERRRPAGPDGAPLRARLHQALDEVDHQIRLLRSVLWWYLLPLAVVAVIIVVGTLQELRLQIGPAAWDEAWGFSLAALAVATVWVGGVFGFVYWLNQRAVRRQLQPHRDEIAALVRQLDTNGVTEEW